MPLSSEDVERLHKAGFIDYEIFGHEKAYDTHETSDLDSPLWQRVLASRRSWLDDKIAQGWAFEEIENAIMHYYARNKERDPWEFLKAEYKPPLKKDYYEAVRVRAQKQTDALYKSKGRRF